MFYFSLRVGIPFEFILPGLLATVSHLMEESIISVSDDHVESCVMYTGLIANPATGKSQSLTFFEKAINEIEKYNETNVSDSKLVEGTKINALLNSIYIICYFFIIQVQQSKPYAQYWKITIVFYRYLMKVVHFMDLSGDKVMVQLLMNALYIWNCSMENLLSKDI
jgi:hypothetical protein